MSIVTHWLFSYPQLLYVHGYWILFLQSVSYLTTNIVTHWLFSYPVICPLLYVHGYWIWFLQEVSYFKLYLTKSIVTHWLFSYHPLLYVHGYYIGFLQLVSYFKLPHFEHCHTPYPVIKIMSTALCTWILNWVPSGGKLFQTTSLWALLHTDCSHTL